MKKSDERKAFMKTCLSGDNGKVSPTQQAQCDGMKVCKDVAVAMKGDERKKFMQTCLSKKYGITKTENKFGPNLGYGIKNGQTHQMSCPFLINSADTRY